LEEEDELLIELVADRVENLCGYKPGPDTVARFLKEYVALKSVPAATPQPSARAQTAAPVTTPSAARIGSSHKPSSIGFVPEGRNYPARSAREVLEGVFEALAKRDATILERFASLPKHGRTRRYIARNSNDLYPGRPDLVRDHSMQLTSGWWLSTNHSHATIERIIEMACDVAHLKYGKDLHANLGE
jgi:hypothetical protein